MKEARLYPEVIKPIQTIPHPQTQTELAAVPDVRQSSIADAKWRRSIPADRYLRLFEKNEATAPTVHRGARVGINILASHPESGELFAVALPYEGIVLRRLLWSQKQERFVLRAEPRASPKIRIQADLADQLLGCMARVIQEV